LRRGLITDDHDFVGYGADPPDPQWPGGEKRRPSLRGIAAELVRQGFVNERGRPFAAQSVASILRS